MKKLILFLLLSITISSCIVVVPQSNLRRHIKQSKLVSKGRGSCVLVPFPENKRFNKVKVWKKQYR